MSAGGSRVPPAEHMQLQQQAQQAQQAPPPHQAQAPPAGAAAEGAGGSSGTAPAAAEPAAGVLAAGEAGLRTVHIPTRGGGDAWSVRMCRRACARSCRGGCSNSIIMRGEIYMGRLPCTSGLRCLSINRQPVNIRRWPGMQPCALLSAPSAAICVVKPLPQPMQAPNWLLTWNGGDARRRGTGTPA